MKEHVDLYFHALSHFIIHNCKENIFLVDYFSLISSLKKKLNLDPMGLVRSLNALYDYYQKEKSLLRVQFLPFCTDSTDGLFRLMDSSNSSVMDTLHKDLRIDTSSNDLSTVESVVPRFLNIIHEASHRIVDRLVIHYVFKNNRAYRKKLQLGALIISLSVTPVSIGYSFESPCLSYDYGYDELEDTDGDGLYDSYEWSVFKTDLDRVDTDKDGTSAL